MTDVTNDQRRAIGAALVQQINTYTRLRDSDTHAREEAEAAQRLKDERASARRKLALDNLTDFMSVVKSEEIERALAEREQVAQRLRAAQDQASASALALARAEAAWERAETHSLTDAQVLTTLREETPRLQAAVAPMEAELAAVEDRLAELRGAAEEKQRQALAAQVWPPAVKRLAAWAREGLALLDEQRATRERLQDAGAWTFAQAQIDELALTGRYGEDQITERLAQWLNDAQRAGYKG